MARALWFIALLAAFVVVGVRCLGAFSPVAAATDERSSVALSQGSHAPSHQEPATNGTIDDDSDDGADALLAASPVQFGLVAVPVLAENKLSILCQQCALQSHTHGLERPPRA